MMHQILHDMTEFTKDAYEKYLIQCEKKNKELDKKNTVFFGKSSSCFKEIFRKSSDANG